MNSNSCDADAFNKAKNIYEKALTKSGYTFTISFDKQSKKKKIRKRKIIWFNPPFSRNVKTKIGKIFIKLIEEHFPTHHKFHKIFNNTP